MEGIRVGAQDLADLFDLHVRRIYQLVHEDVIPQSVAKGKYDLQAAVTGYIRLLQRVAEGKGRTGELSEERLLTARLERRKREIQFAELEGSVVSVEHHRRSMADAFALVRQNLRNVPGALAPRLVGLDDARDVQRVLTPAIDAALRSIVDAAAAFLSDELAADVPARVVLVRAGITTLSDLMAINDLLELRGIGKIRKEQILQWIKETL